jgi:serine/threonine protein phosphatase 1
MTAMPRQSNAIDAGAWRASTPANTRLYAVGDIHGRADLLLEMIERIDDDLRRRPVSYAVEIYLGDYIDRGDRSKDVIDILCRRLVYRNAICLRGNHEALLEAFLDDPDMFQAWLNLGGRETLQSYGLHAEPAEFAPEVWHAALHATLPRTHTLFLQCLRNSYRCGDYLFAHAGIRPGVPLARQTPEDLIWIRNEFLSSKADHGYVVVHGHTPVARPEIHGNRINIDTGAVLSGTLTCIALEGSSIMFL